MSVGPARTVRYGAAAEQAADLWLPAEPVPGVAVLSLHGGYFRPEYERDLHDPLSRWLSGRGLPVCNAEYRRGGSGGFAETEADVLAAADLALELAGVGGRVAAIGHSAGGYLAGLVARHPAVGLVVSMGGVADLREVATHGWDSGAITAWLGARPDADPELYARTDLRRWMPTGAEHVLVHGTDDTTVPVTQSRDLAAALAAAGDPVELVELPGEGHFGFLDPEHPAARAALDRVVRWAGP